MRFNKTRFDQLQTTRFNCSDSTRKDLTSSKRPDSNDKIQTTRFNKTRFDQLQTTRFNCSDSTRQDLIRFKWLESDQIQMYDIRSSSWSADQGSSNGTVPSELIKFNSKFFSFTWNPAKNRGHHAPSVVRQRQHILCRQQKSKREKINNKKNHLQKRLYSQSMRILNSFFFFWFKPRTEFGEWSEFKKEQRTHKWIDVVRCLGDCKWIGIRLLNFEIRFRTFLSVCIVCSAHPNFHLFLLLNLQTENDGSYRPNQCAVCLLYTYTHTN